MDLGEKNRSHSAAWTFMEYLIRLLFKVLGVHGYLYFNKHM